jgi:hypothetical protein
MASLLDIISQWNKQCNYNITESGTISTVVEVGCLADNINTGYPPEPLHPVGIIEIYMVVASPAGLLQDPFNHIS